MSTALATSSASRATKQPRPVRPSRAVNGVFHPMGTVKREARLRICMLAACPFPANHGTPGAIREMSESIAERGHEVHVVTYHIGEDIPVKGVTLHRIPQLTKETGVVVGPTARRPLYDLQMVFKTLQVVKRYRPNVLHAHGYEAALVAYLCRLVTGLPIVYSGHHTMADELASYDVIRPRWLAHGLARMLDVFVSRIGTRCIPHSTNIQRFLHEMGLRQQVEPVINFGIDMKWMDGGDGEVVRRKYQLGNSPIILYTGVFDQFQRLDLLLDAIAKLQERLPEVKLLLVTTIPCEKHIATLRAKIEELRIQSNVIITEPQPLEAIRDFLKACDVAVVPRPQAAGFPIKLLNYMAAGRPCVLFASSASDGLEHGENAYLVSPDKGEALADGIQRVLNNDELRDRIARNGYHYVREHHDRAVIAERVVGAYFRTLAATGRSHITTHRPLASAAKAYPL